MTFMLNLYGLMKKIRRKGIYNIQVLICRFRKRVDIDNPTVYQRQFKINLSQIKETDMRQKTASFTSPQYLDLTTGLYTVLVDGDDFNEPITDTARSILDGHIMLDRKLGHKNHYPAVDILQSLSRVMGDITTAEHKAAAGVLRNLLAVHAKNEDLININDCVTVRLEFAENVENSCTCYAVMVN